MKRVLVSGASGIVGYGILRSLRRSERPCFLVGTSMYDDSVTSNGAGGRGRAMFSGASAPR